MPDNDLTPDELDGLLAKAEKATPGPWEYQDGCSWRRIGGTKPDGTIGDGNVIKPIVHPRDGWPDIQGIESLRFIAACDPDTIRRLVGMARRALAHDELTIEEFKEDFPEEFEDDDDSEVDFIDRNGDEVLMPKEPQ